MIRSRWMSFAVSGLFAAVAVWGAGCQQTQQSGGDSQGDGSQSGAKPRVALIMKSLANEFFATMAEGAKEHQASHVDEYDLVVNGIKDEQDLARQVALVDEMVAAGVDAIVIAPADSKALVPALRNARKAGVVVVNIDNKLDAEALSDAGVSVPFVGPNNREGAKKVGEYLASQLSQGDEVAILEGITTSFNGQQRKAGFEDAMNAAGMSIVSSQSAQWETSKANTVAASMLSEHPNLKAILAANDSMALGAVTAAKDVGKSGEVFVVGFDNISAVQAAIQDGRILATADQHGGDLAVFGIEYALKLIEDSNAEVDDRETPVDLVTAETLTEPAAK